MVLMLGLVDGASSYSCNLWIFWYR